LDLTDEQQIEVATANKAIIFTHDVDFLRMASQKEHSGIIYVHQQKLSIGDCIKRLKAIAETMSTEGMRNKIIYL